VNATVRDFLGSRVATYETVRHPEAPTSQEEAAASHVSGWSWAKVVVVRDATGLALAVLPACCTVDLERLKGLMRHGEVSLASVEDALRLGGACEPGAFPPFGRMFAIDTYVDEALVNQREIVMPGGDHRTAIRMRTSEFLRVAEPQLGHFALHQSGEFPARPRPRRRTQPAIR
jgi:Ala-tRNA(Pro) deacylase